MSLLTQMLRDLEVMLSDQQREFIALVQGLETMRARIAGVDSELPPAVLRDRIAKIRDEGAAPLRSLIASMAARTTSAAVLRDRTTPDAEMRRARFDEDNAVNAQMRLSTYAVLGKSSTPELVAHLEDAAAGNDLALVEAVRLEFHGRTDREKFQSQYAEAYSKMSLPQSQLAQQHFGNISSLAGLGLERFNAMVLGRPDPIAASRLHALRRRDRPPREAITRCDRRAVPSPWRRASAAGP
jgi:hypothetical protein